MRASLLFYKAKGWLFNVGFEFGQPLSLMEDGGWFLDFPGSVETFFTKWYIDTFMIDDTSYIRVSIW